MQEQATKPGLSFWQATSVGVGAIVGGGILALSGVAFSVSGPSALLAFLLNGLIALATALSLGEMVARYPRSGGIYTHARRVLSVESAFGVGWVVWFASILASVLYALGFGAFLLAMVQQVFGPSWWDRGLSKVFALTATAGYLWHLSRTAGGGGVWLNVSKVLAFSVLIAGGLAVAVQTPLPTLRETLTPFFGGGLSGVFLAMGFTFIALQGFDLIAAVAGEVKDPGRTVPKAMLTSLGIALGIYLPLLAVVSTVGSDPEVGVMLASERNPEQMVAAAAQRYLGAFGFWLVLVAGVLSMLSALQANLFAASRMAQTMAKDRTLARVLSRQHPRFETPVPALMATGGVVLMLLLLLPNVATAGAASSLIFLLSFAVVHAIALLMRHRGGTADLAFRIPAFPAVPLAGLLACVALAVFQGTQVPAAGTIVLLWLFLGAGLFIGLFSNRARVMDASAEALDPELMRLRGRSPLVLVPIANPANASSMVVLAHALTPPPSGKAVLLSVIETGAVSRTLDERIQNAQEVLRSSVEASMRIGMTPETLTTLAPEPWDEIARVVTRHRCESLLLGLSNFAQSDTTLRHLERLTSSVSCDVVVFRPPFAGWDVHSMKRVLVPVAGNSPHDTLRARLLGSLWRTARPEITFLQIVPAHTSADKLQELDAALRRYAAEEVPGIPLTRIVTRNDVADALVELAGEYDTLLMGLAAPAPGRRIFGSLTQRLALDTQATLIMIGRAQ